MYRCIYLYKCKSGPLCVGGQASPARTRVSVGMIYYYYFYVCVYRWIHLHRCMHASINLSISHPSISARIRHTSICLPLCMFVRMCVCVCVCVCDCALYVRVHKYVCACTHVHLSGPVSNHQASIYTGRCGTDDVAAAVGAAIFRPPAHLAPLLASALQLLPGHVVALQVFPPHAHARSACHSILHGRAVAFCIGVHAERLEARLAPPVCWRVRV